MVTGVQDNEGGKAKSMFSGTTAVGGGGSWLGDAVAVRMWKEAGVVSEGRGAMLLY